MVEKIKDLCKDRNLSIAALERECELSNGTVCKWDDMRPSVDRIAKVARYFDKPIEYFLEEENHEANECA